MDKNPDFNSQEVKKAVLGLKKNDEELAYLAFLTVRGVKPLSRWEKPLDDNGVGLLEQMGLIVRPVRRTVKTGAEVTETIFSISDGYILVYESRFADKPVDKSAQTVRFEGYLFGFPPCCVDEYIRQPYAKNGLADEKQKLLFHWACRNCKITKFLLPAYEKVYNLLNGI